MTTEKVRSEEDKLTQAPIKVMLGGKEYDIKPLVIRDARAWRGKVAQVLQQIPKYLNVTTDNPEGFAEAMNSILVNMPDSIVDLFFGYAKDLKREEIESIASEQELANAFQEVMKYGFPLLNSLPKLLTRTQQ